MSLAAAGAAVLGTSRVDGEVSGDGSRGPSALGSRAGERLALGQVDGEPQGGVEGLADAGVALAVGGDPLRVAADAVLVGAVDAEVLAGEVDGVAVDRAGVADVGLLLGLGPVAGEGGGAVDGCALGGEAVQRVVEPDGRGAFAGGVLCTQPRLVDLDQPRFGAGLAQQQGERVALGSTDSTIAVWPFSIRLGRGSPGWAWKV